MHIIHQTGFSDIKVDRYAGVAVKGLIKEGCISTNQGLDRIFVDLDSVAELVSALQDELNFLRPTTEQVHPGQGRLFDPDNY
jgi:hypothetical protein